jgi:hypothetical protein
MADKRQVHRVELVIELDDTDVGDWVDGVYEQYNKLLSQPVILSSDTTPLDIESPENKWIKDIISESTA